MYYRLLHSIRVKAKNLLSKDRSSIPSLSFQEIPSSNAGLNDWALNISSLLSKSICTEDDIKDLLLVLAGLISSSRNAFTPEVSQFSAIRLFCKTNGFLQEFLALHSTEPVSDYPCDLTSSSFEKILPSHLVSSLSLLMRDGYVIWPQSLSSSLVDQFTDFMSHDLSWHLVHDGDQSSKYRGVIGQCNSLFIKASTNLDLSHPLVSKFSHDSKLKSVIDSYLGGYSVLRSASLWITRPSSENFISTEAAQMYHYDLDTLKWIKVFLYLSDVTEESGPHCALPATHLPDSKHPTLLSRLYSRLSDNDIASYQRETPLSFTGPAGTIILGDTKAYHKGMPTLTGERILIQLFYSCSNFSLSFGD